MYSRPLSLEVALKAPLPSPGGGSLPYHPFRPLCPPPPVPHIITASRAGVLTPPPSALLLRGGEVLP